MMKVLILTKLEYEDFLNDVISQYNNQGHLFLLRLDDGKVSNWDEINGIGYDLGISFMYQHKVPKSEIDKATWINFHPAPLPEYKGRNLCYHAIMNGEREFGATVHYMDENFDTGDIIEVVKQFTFPSDTAESLSERTIKLSKELFRVYLPRILAGEQFERKPNVGGTYYKKENIDVRINMDNYEWLRDYWRALYFPPHYPKIEIGGVTYKIVKDE